MTREKSNAFEKQLKIKILFQKTLKKHCKYIKNIFFWIFVVFHYFFGFFKKLIKMVGQKLGNNTTDKGGIEVAAAGGNSGAVMTGV